MVQASMDVFTVLLGDHAELSRNKLLDPHTDAYVLRSQVCFVLITCLEPKADRSCVMAWQMQVVKKLLGIFQSKPKFSAILFPDEHGHANGRAIVNHLKNYVCSILQAGASVCRLDCVVALHFG